MYDVQIVDARSFAMRALGTVLALAVLAGAFACGYFLGLRNVSDHGGGVDRTAGQLEQATANQRQLTSDLRTAAEQARGLGDSIEQGRAAVSDGAAAADRIAAANSDITGQVDEAGTIIERSQQILRDVRQRGESKTAPH